MVDEGMAAGPQRERETERESPVMSEMETFKIQSESLFVQFV